MDELAKRFADLAEKYGPSVADAAKQAARTEAFSCLARGTMAALIAAAFVYAGLWLWRKANGDDWDDEWMIGSIILWVIAIIPACIALWSWIDPWTWTTINHPELWIAKKAFQL